MSGPVPIVAISWIIELPRDLGLPDDWRAEIARVGCLHGWENEDLRRLPRWDAPVDMGSVHPVTALRFRRANVSVGMPTEATDRCFGEMQAEMMSTSERRAYNEQLTRLVTEGAREWKTVVRITQWYAAQELPPPDDPDDWLREELRVGLSVLNRWLATYALVSVDLYHGPVALTDLPYVLPVVMEARTTPDEDVAAGFRMLPIHESVPALVGAQADMNAVEASNRSLLMTWDDNPFLYGLQLLFGAQGHLASGRERQAVLDSGTGIEMIVASLVRAVGHERTSFDEQAAGRADFRSRFEHHLPRALGDGTSPATDPGGARSTWWDKGYRLRNSVVHQGHVATPSEAQEAIHSAWRMIEAFGTQLRGSSDTEWLGELLRVAWK